MPRPIVEINALEQYGSIEAFPEEPRLIRLHGDFWHGNVLNTEGELEKTPSIRFDAVRRLLNSYGLIVIGYGGNDVSVMRGLFDPLKNDKRAYKKGLFWLCHKKDMLSPLVESFLQIAPDDRAFLVEIESFDNAMRQFSEQFGK